MSLNGCCLLLKAVICLQLLRSSLAVVNGAAELTTSIHGDFVTVADYGLIPGAASVYASEQGRSACHCMNKCIVDTVCNGVSYDPSFMCYFTSTTASSLDNSTVQPTPDSTFVFWTSTYNPSKAEFYVASDGLTYLYVDESLIWNEANNICNNLPGFRLAVFTEEGQQTLPDTLKDLFGSEYWVGMRRNDTDIVWSNGVAYADSVMNGVFDLTGGTNICFKCKPMNFEARQCDDKKQFLCQAIF